VVPLDGTVSAVFPGGCRVAVESGGRCHQFEFPKYPGMRFRKSPQSVIVEFPLGGRLSAGLSLWSDEKIDATAKSLTLNIRRFVLDAPQEMYRAAPWPGERMR
jgi:hypothetical protein